MLTASASRAGGGVFEAVVRQADLIRAAGGAPCVFALTDEHVQADRARLGDTPVRDFRVRGPKQPGWAPGLLRALLAAELDLLHLHGIWLYPSYAGARWARATRRPYIVSPHGMLDPWITERGRAKKALARWGYERASWREAAALHALTQAEAADISRETGREDSLVIPNAAPSLAPARARAGQGIVYLGRIHPKKNLAALITAWRGLAAGEATLTIAGWGGAADVAALERDVAAAGSSVRFVGAVHGEAKDALLRDARALILPSFSEGLPMVILEAWAAGTPTVITAQCNLPDGLATGAALACGHDAVSIGTALATTLQMKDTEWQRRSAAAQGLAASRFSLERVSMQWTQAYRRLAE
ncbi:glycosyltransferase [Sphingomonas bacterium]|uniref:glycosyltransferase n=1 Tax=Sphingomonas bacterium TaxID=1895847 RepID=UPI00261250D7|nr:glycosyltransferase [Sphingomonas bacterium]